MHDPACRRSCRHCLPGGLHITGVASKTEASHPGRIVSPKSSARSGGACGELGAGGEVWNVSPCAAAGIRIRSSPATKHTVDEDVPEILIDGSPYFKEPEPVNYVLAVEPGVYALTHYAIEVGCSTFDAKVDTAGRAIWKAVHPRRGRVPARFAFRESGACCPNLISDGLVLACSAGSEVIPRRSDWIHQSAVSMADIF